MLGKRLFVNEGPDKERAIACNLLCNLACKRSAEALCTTTTNYNSKYNTYRATNFTGSGD